MSSAKVKYSPKTGWVLMQHLGSITQWGGEGSDHLALRTWIWLTMTQGIIFVHIDLDVTHWVNFKRLGIKTIILTSDRYRYPYWIFKSVEKTDASDYKWLQVNTPLAAWMNTLVVSNMFRFHTDPIRWGYQCYSSFLSDLKLKCGIVVNIAFFAFKIERLMDKLQKWKGKEYLVTNSPVPTTLSLTCFSP